MKVMLSRFYFVLVLLGIFLHGCRPSTKGETELLSTGIEAIDNANKAIQSNPGDAFGYFQRAQLYHEYESYNQAIKDMASALQIDSLNMDFHLFLADIYLDAYQSQKAIATLERATALFPTNTKTLLKLAEFQLILRQHQASMSTIRKIMEKDPQNLEALFLLGMNYRDTGDNRRAIQSFQTIVELDAEQLDSWIMLGNLLDEENDPLAMQCFDNVISFDSNHIAAWHSKAFYYQNHQDIQSALNIYRKINRIDNQYPDAYLNAGILFLELDSFNRAKEQFDFLVNVDPSNPMGYYYKGLIEEQEGNTEKALTLYNQAIRLAPDFTRAREAADKLTSSEDQ
jgi:tetratricopeptide (TPR) repeat protein